MKNALLIILALLAVAGCGVSFLLLRMPQSGISVAIVEKLGVGKQETVKQAPPAVPKETAPAAEKVEEVEPEADEESVADAPADDGKGNWKFLSSSDWYAGKKISEKDLRGKVVLVYEWSSTEKPSVAMLTRIEEIWSSFKHKPLVVIGSHRGGRNDKIPNAYKKLGLTFPMYEGAGFRNEPISSSYPYIYIVNYKGRVVFRGRNDRPATEALVNAITAAQLKQ